MWHRYLSMNDSDFFHHEVAMDHNENFFGLFTLLQSIGTVLLQCCDPMASISANIEGD